MTTEQPMPVLDDLAGMQSVDKRNMLRLINELPEQCETALGIGRGFAREPLSIKPNVVLFVGVGDSGLAADMAAEALAEEVEVPVVSQHESRMPLCIGEESLVFVIDYSGRSQTALRAYRAACELGATVLCLASRGKLREAVMEPKTILNVPSGQPSRCAIGYLLLAPLAAVEKLGLALGAVEKASHAVKLLKNMREFLRPDTRTARNTAKQIAEALFEKTPMICGAPGYRSLVAARWKSQIGASAKLPACSGVFPDLVDGEICAWEQPGGACSNPAFVFLTDASDRTNENQAIMQAAGELFAKFKVVEAEMKGSTTIERMLYGAYLGDYVSYYLAIMRGVDPLEAQSVAFIDERLAPPEPVRVPPPAPEPETESEAGE